MHGVLPLALSAIRPAAAGAQKGLRACPALNLPAKASKIQSMPIEWQSVTAASNTISFRRLCRSEIDHL